MTVASVRILLVDDDDTMRLVCRRFFSRLEDVGVLVIEEAESGEQAIEMLSDRPFDCVLSDYRMGTLSGIDVLAYAKKERPEAVRILFTGFAAPDIQRAATAEANVHAFLEKPMTTAELETLLREKMVEPFLKPLATKRAHDLHVNP